MELDSEEEQDRNKENGAVKETTCLDQVKGFGVLFWLICLLGIFIYSSVISFINISIGLFIEIFLNKLPKQDAQTIAGVWMCVPYLIGAILIPLLGKRIFWLFKGL